MTNKSKAGGEEGNFSVHLQVYALWMYSLLRFRSQLEYRGRYPDRGPGHIQPKTSVSVDMAEQLVEFTGNRRSVWR
jgi:hypothetical protein